MPKKRFEDEKLAKEFAKQVKGRFKDLRNSYGAKSKFAVVYWIKIKPNPKQTSVKTDWCQEEGRDFGYSNEYWND